MECLADFVVDGFTLDNDQFAHDVWRLAHVMSFVAPTSTGLVLLQLDVAAPFAGSLEGQMQAHTPVVFVVHAAWRRPRNDEPGAGLRNLLPDRPCVQIHQH